MRIAQFHAAIMTIVLIGGTVALGICERDWQTVVAVSGGGIVLCHGTAYRFLDDLHTVTSVVHRLGDAGSVPVELFYLLSFTRPSIYSKQNFLS